jgi:arylsulfatase
MTGMIEAVFINVKNRSKTITAEIEVPPGGANGTVIAQGGRFGGWSLQSRTACLHMTTASPDCSASRDGYRR